jgi:hypothetical protein
MRSPLNLLQLLAARCAAWHVMAPAAAGAAVLLLGRCAA